jgi:hypothetical protein
MNKMDTREEREDIAGNAAVRAVPLVLLSISCSVPSFHPSQPRLARGALQCSSPLKREINGLLSQSFSSAEPLQESLGIKEIAAKTSETRRPREQDLSWFLLLER